MKKLLPCPKCRTEHDVSSILEHSDFSWPELGWIYFKCPHCSEHTHIYLDNNIMATVNYLGAPGPNWNINKSIDVPNLVVRIDPKFLHVWNNEKHYEFAAKE